MIELAADEDAAALLFLEAGGADRNLRREHDSLLGRLEHELGEKAAADPGLGLGSLPPAALLGGAAHIAAARIMGGRVDALAAVFDDLFAWVDSYRLPVDADPPGMERWRELGSLFPALPPTGEEVTGPLPSPRGRNALSGAAAAEARRGKILTAVAQMVAAKGYRECGIDDIVATAHVSRAAFYSHFASKEDAFLAAQTRGFQESIAAAVTGFSVAPTWPRRIWAGLREMLTFVAQHPAVARTCLLETPAAGRTAIQRDHENRMAYGLFLEEGFRSCDPPRLPSRLHTEAITGAIFGLMRRQVLQGRGAAMLEVLAPAAFVTLAPFLGALPALRFVEAEAQHPG
ncbi:MAG TPA: TetR/AcrR family transcriptional regulator [Solirubrobacterales bacterium]|nr:TetR/AcrR family transcriptional regulator [Solirubrobacterales bacterium]